MKINLSNICKSSFLFLIAIACLPAYSQVDKIELQNCMAFDMAIFIKEMDREYGLNNLTDQQAFEIGYKQKNLLARYTPTLRSIPNDNEILAIVNNAKAYADKLQKTPESALKQKLVSCYAKYR